MNGDVIITHFSNPSDDQSSGVETWKSNVDESYITGEPELRLDDPIYPTKNFQYNRVKATSSKFSNGQVMDNVKYVLRVNTKNGVSPLVDLCQVDGSITKVEYEAEYWFYN